MCFEPYYVACCLRFLLAAEFNGYISDEACGWNNAREGEEARECAEKCVKAGWPPVFVLDSGMKVFKITLPANRQKVMPFVGVHVTITGELKGQELRVERVRNSPAPAKKKT